MLQLCVQNVDAVSVANDAAVAVIIVAEVAVI